MKHNEVSLWTAILSSALGAMITLILVQSPGCANKTKPGDPSPQIGDVAQTNADVATSVTSHADKIDSNVTDITKLVGPVILPKIEPAVASTRVETTGLRSDADRLQATLAQLEAVKANVERLVASGDKQARTIDKLQREKESALYRLLMSLVVMSVVAVGVAVVLFVSGNVKAAVPLGVGAIATLITAIVVQAYLPYLLVTGGVLLLGGLGYAGYRMLIERRATSDLVRLGEAAKLMLPDARRRELFGNGAIPGIAEQIQAPSTQALVNEVRQSLGAKLAPSLPPEAAKIILT